MKMVPIFVSHRHCSQLWVQEDKYEGVILCESENELQQYIDERRKEPDRDEGVEVYRMEFSRPLRIFVVAKTWKKMGGGLVMLHDLPRGFTRAAPRYAIMAGICVCLVQGHIDVPQTYYRHAGAWTVKFEWREGGPYSVSHMDSLNGHLLTPVTKERWEEDNAGYI